MHWSAEEGLQVHWSAKEGLQEHLSAKEDLHQDTGLLKRTYKYAGLLKKTYTYIGLPKRTYQYKAFYSDMVCSNVAKTIQRVKNEYLLMGHDKTTFEFSAKCPPTSGTQLCFRFGYYGQNDLYETCFGYACARQSLKWCDEG